MNTINLLVSAAIYFHSGDYVPKYEFSYYPCEYDQIFIEGLSENNAYLVSNDLHFYDDEEIFVLNPSFTHFEIRDNVSNEIIGELNIRWKEDGCGEPSEIELPSNGYSGIISPETIKIKPSELNKVLNDVYVYENGLDITHRLKMTPIVIDVPGKYIINVSAVINDEIQEKNIIVFVEDDNKNKNDNNKQNTSNEIRKAIVLAIIIMVIKWLN